MSKFYVGQRVRCAWSVCEVMMHHVGKEGRIIGHSPLHADGWYVDAALHDADGDRCCWGEASLEPLTDPGREVVSWEACEWKPEHLRAIPA